MKWLLGLLLVSLPAQEEVRLGRPPGAREAALTQPEDAPATAVDDAFLARVLLAFKDKSAPERARILKSVRAAVDAIADPYLDSLRPFAQVAPQDAKSRIGKLPWKDPGAAEDAGDAPLYAELPFPVRNHYRFGFRSIIPVVQEGTKARDKPRFPAAAPDDEQLRAMLLGFLPDLDLILAGLLRALDNDRAADRYACFLECWRNSGESFYRALDRTAGTGGSVFFFDAMLTDYLRSFVPRAHKDYKALVRSNDAAHHALHAAFLGYRQYRGLREAIAFALVLPPATPLPEALARYQAPLADGVYNIREQVDILLRIHGHDVNKIVLGMTAAAAPLPKDLWTDTYTPFPSFREFYRAALEQTEVLDGSSDALLTDQHEQRSKVADLIVRTARTALAATGIQ